MGRRDLAVIVPILGYSTEEERAEATASRVRELSDATTVLGTNAVFNDEFVLLAKATAIAYTAADEPVILVDTSGGGVTITLPPAAGVSGRTYIIKKTTTDGNTVTIDGNGAETIDGAATATFTTSRGVREVYSDGTAWHILRSI